jgi:prepilin-type N-terminal cleavage/methylation domain-containing protein/prepilin-type processing-associated H-X9-DG protein
MRKKAFSLLELLIVIATVAVLAALCFPAFSRARHKAEKAACINNLRQLGIGLQNLVADNNSYPSIIGTTNTGNWSWSIALETELSGKPKRINEFINRGIWHCPAAPKYKPWPPSNGREAFSSYGYNAFGVLPGWTTNLLGLNGLPAHLPISKLVGSQPVPETGVAIPAEMMAIADSIDGMVLFRRWLMEWGRYPGWNRRQFGRASDRHQGSINVLFCDYHIESPTITKVFQDKSDAALQRWNRDHLPHRDELIR